MEFTVGEKDGLKGTPPMVFAYQSLAKAADDHSPSYPTTLGHLTSASGVIRKLWNQTSPSISLSDAVRDGMISCSHWALQPDEGTLNLIFRSVHDVVPVTGFVSASNTRDSAQEICQTGPLSVRRLDDLTASSRS